MNAPPPLFAPQPDATIHRALIVGASGSVGSALTRHLQAEGALVRPFRRWSSPPSHPLIDVPEHDWAVGDVLEVQTLRRAAAGCDVIFYAVQHTRHPDRSLIAETVTGVRNICEVARDAEVNRLVLVFGADIIDTDTDGALASSRDRRSPRADDAEVVRAHIFADLEARKFMAFGLPAIKLHLALALGPLPPHAPGVAFVKALEARPRLSMGGYTNVIDVRDAAAGIYAAGTRGQLGETYLLAGHNLTIAELRHAIAATLERRALPIDPPQAVAETAHRIRQRLPLSGGLDALARALGVRTSYLEVEAARRALGLEVRPLEDSLRVMKEMGLLVA